MTAEWHYHGHYGQLGPLTREQIDELIVAQVSLRDTLVWRNGMVDWLPAVQVPELRDHFSSEVNAVPPPLPQERPSAYATPPSAPRSFLIEPPSLAQRGYAPLASERSDKNQYLAGVLQLVFPGVGRLYLGYTSLGLSQLLLSLCGVGILWSYIDGIVLLCGGVKMDGYGRRLSD